MKFIPILFSTPMVMAILADRKTMTRRIIKPEPLLHNDIIKMPIPIDEYGKQIEGWQKKGYTLIGTGLDNPLAGYVHPKCRYGQPGDVLWVRENFRKYYRSDENGYMDHDNLIIDYAADNPEMIPMVDGDGFQIINKDGTEKYIGFTPSIHMPKTACRIFLEVTNVRAERLHDISYEDAIAEGVERIFPGKGILVYKDYLIPKCGTTPYSSFRSLWKKINGPESWDANPWLWVIEFKRIEKPINFLKAEES